MIELLRALPSLLIVTPRASLISELAPMRIVSVMTDRTLRAQPQEGPVQRASSSFEIQDFPGKNELPPVTGSAVCLPVLPPKGVSRRVMIEGLCIEMHHPEIFS
jgi:hypothetical protein